MRRRRWRSRAPRRPALALPSASRGGPPAICALITPCEAINTGCIPWPLVRVHAALPIPVGSRGRSAAMAVPFVPQHAMQPPPGALGRPLLPLCLCHPAPLGPRSLQAAPACAWNGVQALTWVRPAPRRQHVRINAFTCHRLGSPAASAGISPGPHSHIVCGGCATLLMFPQVRGRGSNNSCMAPLAYTCQILGHAMG